MYGWHVFPGKAVAAGLFRRLRLSERLHHVFGCLHRPVDLLTLAVDAVQDARIVAPDRKIDLTLGSGAAFLVLGDEPRLRPVMQSAAELARSGRAVRPPAVSMGDDVPIPATSGA